MWLSINEPKVYAFLKANGFVYTVRHYPAKEPFIRQVMVGRKLTGEKVSIISTQYPARNLEVPPHESLYLRVGFLRKYVHISGFASAEEWDEAISRQHMKPINTLHVKHKTLWLLRVELVNKPQLENTELKSEI